MYAGYLTVHSFYFQILVNKQCFVFLLFLLLTNSMKFVTDNLTYQGWDDPYVPRTHEGLLKWKYANLNSVDFLFEVVSSPYCVWCLEFLILLVNFCLLLMHQLNFRWFCWQVDDDRELLFLYERGKKKLMEGNKVAFPGQTNFYFILSVQFFL